ncbi:uncharacterized protein DNG_02592 [Cephalotrichum gorgonifer]|uniref:Mid2 domain-containing protein n=1 Tax=Cephalotrichum gorgonifer TaxID=2041049 RepID=A0AAE8ST78_9PEZI|nr:uncharacterized protein DNG_02592 [Cephalotrichum gorgonifer]
MYFSRLIRALLVALSIVSVAQAIGIDHAPGAPAGAVVRRQQDSSDTSKDVPSPTPTTSDKSTTTSDDNTPTPTTTPPTDPTDNSPSPTPSNTATDETTTTTSKTDKTEETSSSKTQEKPITETHTTVITTTNSEGKPTSFTTESTVVRTPGLSSDDDSGKSQSMSPETRNIVIGCVVGVGGAIVLGGLGFVAWRIWGRKKATEESDAFGAYEPMDKSDAGRSSPSGGVVGGPQRNPFQQTLETYHAPTQVNASSNF